MESCGFDIENLDVKQHKKSDIGISTDVFDLQNSDKSSPAIQQETHKSHIFKHVLVKERRYMVSQATISEN